MERGQEKWKPVFRPGARPIKNRNRDSYRGFELRVWPVLGAALLIASFASAQPVPRIRARIIAFDGKTLTLQPDGTSADADWLRVGILPNTRYVSTAAAKLSAIRPGDFAGAAVIADPDGKLQAQEVHVYPGPLRGAGEGRFPEGVPGRIRINGAVAAAADGSLTLHYRGAAMNKEICEGRAAVPIRPQACTGDAVIAIADGVPVTALTPGDKSLLTPGAMAVVSVVTSPDGTRITPGLIVEKTTAAP